MKIIAIKTEVLKGSMNFNDDNTEITFQANAYLGVEGNPYINKLNTPETIFNLKCAVSEVANIQVIAEAQVNAYVEQNYPIAND